MKYQRTGLTEGTLIYNEWLKSKGLYRKETEDEFINWLYSTSGWYDSEIKGSYFDIDTEAVRQSLNYQRFLVEFHDALLGSDMLHLMLHGDYHLNGLEFQEEFANRFSPVNYCYWKDVPLMQSKIKDQRLLVVSSIAGLIKDKYGQYPILAYDTPQTHLNRGQDKNSFETLDRVFADLLNYSDSYDLVVISFGAYGVLLADKLHKTGKSVMTIGSGIYELFPVGEIPEKYKPKGYEKIENGRYWTSK